MTVCTLYTKCISPFVCVDMSTLETKVVSPLVSQGRAVDSQLREVGFESCAAVLNFGILFTLHCSSSFICTNEYLAVDSRYLYKQIIAAWLDAS